MNIRSRFRPKGSQRISSQYMKGECELGWGSGYKSNLLPRETCPVSTKETIQAILSSLDMRPLPIYPCLGKRHQGSKVWEFVNFHHSLPSQSQAWDVKTRIIIIVIIIISAYGLYSGLCIKRYSKHFTSHLIFKQLHEVDSNLHFTDEVIEGQKYQPVNKVT